MGDRGHVFITQFWLGVMRKRYIAGVVIAGLAAISLVVLLYGFWNTKNRKQAIAEQLESIPDFKFHQLDGTPYTRDSLPQHRPTVFVWFHTDCDFCRNEVKDITAHLSEFADTQILFVSTEPAETIQAFAISSGLATHPSVVLLEDRQMIFPVRFAVTTTPYTLVYGRNSRLLNRFHGQILSSSILKTLRDNVKIR